MTKIYVFPILLLFYCLQLNAQNNNSYTEPSGGEYIFEKNDAAHPCISPIEYQKIETEIALNNTALGIHNNSEYRIMTTLFNWPLKAAAGLSDCGFHFIGGYVDEDTLAGRIKDFNCEINTYDTHKGTDIAIWPYGFYKMDNNQVEVIAAAAGTIIARSDGNFDRNCAANNLTANYVVIQHGDGSVALYWHMKKNSITSKIVGQTIIAGEYLGIVGSSGSSSGPHLHFEIWSGSTSATRKDPYSGACNYLNTNSWWSSQRPHTDPTILKVSVNTTDLVMSTCPTTETPNESTSYTIPFQGAGLSPGYAKFYIFMREIPAATTLDLKILNPNGTTFSSWTHTVNTFYKVSYWGWSKLLPTIAGTYKFQATYNGVTCSQSFDIITALTATITANSSTTFCQGDSVILTATSGASYLWNNGATTRSINVKANGSFSVKVTFTGGGSATSATTTVTVNPLPTATITASGAVTFCQGDSVILTASIGSSYLWNNGLTTRSITVKANGSFSVKVTNANACFATSATTTATLKTPQNRLLIILRNDTLFSPYLQPNNWYITGNSTSIDAGLFHKCTQPASYYVTGQGANGCMATSNTLLANCSLTGIRNKSNLEQLQVYPNPTKNTINISGSGIENGNYIISLTDIIGDVLYMEDFRINNSSIEKIIYLSDLANDIYFLTIETDNKIFIKKIIKQQ